MATVTGVVEAVSTKFGKFSVMVNGGWYGTKAEWATVKPNKGDTITFDDGGKNYFKNPKITAAAPEAATASSGSPSTSGGRSYGNKGVFPVPIDDGSRAIIRQNAITNAHKVLEYSDFDTDISNDDLIAELIRVARHIEAYTSGDMDMEAAKEMVATMENKAFDLE